MISLGNSLSFSNADIPIYTHEIVHMYPQNTYVQSSNKKFKTLKIHKNYVHTKIIHNINEGKEPSVHGFELICNTDDKEIFKIIP